MYLLHIYNTSGFQFDRCRIILFGYLPINKLDIFPLVLFHLSFAALHFEVLSLFEFGALVLFVRRLDPIEHVTCHTSPLVTNTIFFRSGACARTCSNLVNVLLSSEWNSPSRIFIHIVVFLILCLLSFVL